MLVAELYNIILEQLVTVSHLINQSKTLVVVIMLKLSRGYFQSNKKQDAICNVRFIFDYFFNKSDAYIEVSWLQQHMPVHYRACAWFSLFVQVAWVWIM